MAIPPWRSSEGRPLPRRNTPATTKRAIMNDDKRERIKTAAAECLARFGYEKTTMEDIAGRVGLNKASLYYYYKNKEAIFTEVVIQEARQFLSALQDKIQTVSGSRNRIQTYLVERLRYYQQVVNLHQLSIETINQVQPRFKALYATVLEREIDFIDRILQEGFQAGDIRSRASRRLARAILTVADALKHAACCQTENRWPADIDYTSVEAELRLVVDLIMDGIENRPAEA